MWVGEAFVGVVEVKSSYQGFEMRARLRQAHIVRSVGAFVCCAGLEDLHVCGDIGENFHVCGEDGVRMPEA